MSDVQPKRRRYRFSLRALFVGILAVALVCGWFAAKLQVCAGSSKRLPRFARRARKLGTITMKIARPSGLPTCWVSISFVP